MINIQSLAVTSLVLGGMWAVALPLWAQESVEDEMLPKADVINESILPASYKVQILEESSTGPVGDFVVGPGKIELELEPGESLQTSLSVSNRTGATTTFTLMVEDAAGSSDPNTPIVLLGDETGPYTLKDYIQIEDLVFELGHNQKVQIPVRVILPADAEPGGRYGSVLVTTSSTREETDDGAPRSAIVSRVGALFFVTTPGLDTREGSLKSFDTVPAGKNYFTKGPIPFGILFENTGSVHLNPYGEIRIKNLLGSEIGVIEVDPWYAMPNSVRLREIPFPREFLFGYYTATLELNRSYNNEIDTASMSFIVVDWNRVLIIFGGIIVLWYSVRFISRRFEFRRKE